MKRGFTWMALTKYGYLFGVIYSYLKLCDFSICQYIIDYEFEWSVERIGLQDPFTSLSAESQCGDGTKSSVL